MMAVPICVVGVGHLGKEHARILSTLPGVELVGVVDPRPAHKLNSMNVRSQTRLLRDPQS